MTWANVQLAARQHIIAHQITMAQVKVVRHAQMVAPALKTQPVLLDAIYPVAVHLQIQSEPINATAQHIIVVKAQKNRRMAVVLFRRRDNNRFCSFVWLGLGFQRTFVPDNF